MLRILGAVALLALSSIACHTGDRLWRITPFEGGASGDRINLWPLAYHDGDETSVLWPLFDVDSRGFALRPIVARDDDAYSILFPLASFDTKEGTGWIFPFYRFARDEGLFPLVNLGTLSYAGPFWWTARSRGLFPLACFGDASYVGPVWWRRGGSAFGFFPVFGRRLLGSDFDHVGPVWWRPEAKSGYDRGLLPVFFYGEGGGRFALLPFYSHDLGPEVRSRSALLGLWHASRSDERDETWLAPVYYHTRQHHPQQPEKSETLLLPFFWKRTRGEGSEVYTLLGNRSVDPHRSTLNLYPFWWSSGTPDSGWKMLFPLFFFARSADERTLITPLGGRGWSRSGEDSFVNFLGPLYHHSQSKSRDESRTAFLWPLFERHRAGQELTTRVAGLYSATTRPGGSESTYVFGLGHVRRSESGSSHRVWPLYSRSDEDEVPGPVYALTLYGARDRDAARKRWLFPFFASETAANRRRWDALLGLAHREHEDLGATRAERWWIWPLVSRSEGAGTPGFTDEVSLLGSASWEGGRFLQVGSSLIHARTEERDGERELARSRTLLLFGHEEERTVGPRVPASQTRQIQNRTRREAFEVFLDAVIDERETYQVWRKGVLEDSEARVLHAYSSPEAGDGSAEDRKATAAVLADHGVEVDAEDPESLRSAIDGFAATNTHTIERRYVRVPLFYEYERTDDELERSRPLEFVHYQRDGNGSRLSVLYYAYRSETRAGGTTRDVFPFVTWDSGPDESRFSFLWHFLRYERRGDRRGGHVLFVPWGDI